MLHLRYHNLSDRTPKAQRRAKSVPGGQFEGSTIVEYPPEPVFIDL
jgi:hypothetical protein